MSGHCDFCGIWHSGGCCHPGRAIVANQAQRIAALERELNETVGALQEILKNLKGNKIVHSNLVSETLRSSEVARDNVKFLNAKNQEYANAMDAIRLEMHGVEDQNEKLEQELSEARQKLSDTLASWKIDYELRDKYKQERDRLQSELFLYKKKGGSSE